MSARATPIAWLTLLLAAALLAASEALLVLAHVETEWYYTFALYPLFLAALGLIVASRQPANPMLWVFLASALLIAFASFSASYGLFGVHEELTIPAAREAAWVADWTWPLWDFAPAVLILLLFPNGRLVSRRWRPVVWLAATGLALAMVGSALWPGALKSDEELSMIENPFGVESAGATFQVLAVLGTGLLVASIVAAAASLVVRLERARGGERRQLEWVAMGGIVWVLALVVGLAFVAFHAWGEALFSLAPFAIVLPTALAILRRRLFDVEIVLRRTLVYGFLSALLAGCYFGIVLALQQVFSSFAGGGDLAIAVSTLAVAALFRPVRSRIQSGVDRRFYRRRYDAQRTLEAFSARLRDEIDLDALAAELGAVVQETMHPAHVSLWLREVPR